MNRSDANFIKKLSSCGGGIVAGVTILAFLLRAVVATWLPGQVIWSDGARYLKIADHLLNGEGFGSLLENRFSIPTQPLLIAAVFSVFGKSFLVLRIFFALLGTLSCWLGYLLAKRLFDPLTAIIAALLLALYPYYIYLSALFEYPQTFFILVMAGGLLFLYDFFDSGRKSILFLSGLCLGVGILSVPTTMIFMPFVVLTLGARTFKVFVIRGLIVFVAAAIPVGAWTLRNLHAYGEPILVNKAAGFNFWVANNETYYELGKKAVVPPCTIGYEKTSLCKQSLALYKRLNESHLSDNEYVAQHESASWANGLEFIRTAPGKFALLTIRKFLQYWSPVPDAVNSGAAYGGAARDWIAIASYTPILALAVVGFIFSANRWQRFLPIYFYFLAFTAPYCIFLPATRYRLPLDFFLAIFAAYTLSRLIGALGAAPVCGYDDHRQQAAMFVVRSPELR